MIDAALMALGILADPSRLAFLGLGVALGLMLGILPGLGGVIGLSLLLPFTWDMDSYTALAFLMGLTSVVVTSDTITSVLLGVPGTVGSAATIMDGYPMARKGEASRAFGAAFSASLIGGCFGALLLALCVPILRPVMLAIATPEMLSFCIFGLSIAAVLSGGSPLKGLVGVCIGVLVATTGDDPQTGTLRWTFDLFYLWDGVNIVPLALGLFALPELADLAIQRRPVQSTGTLPSRWSQVEGVRDTLRQWWLTLRCATIGAMLGAIPGIGGSVIDWVAYGHAARTEKGADSTFGTGDVRGVIASEASNNAKEGGALVPTVAFGVPGSASMVLILGAFLIHGLVPGPDMLTKNLDVTFTLIWSIALANVLGAAVCFAFSHELAKLALVRIGILAPAVLALVFVGAFQGSHQWGDLYVLLTFGMLGWFMKRLHWPRPPLALGFVLGAVFEQYLYISYQLYLWDWMLRPIVLGVLAVALFGLLRPMHRAWRARRGARAEAGDTGVALAFGLQSARPELVFNVLVLAMFVYAIRVSSEWEIGARLVPQIVAWFGVAFVVALTAREYFLADGEPLPRADFLDAGRSERLFDNVTEFTGLTASQIAGRGLGFFAWCLGIAALAAVVGLLPALLVFLVAYMRVEGRESWAMSLAVAVPLVALSYVVFHRIVHVSWPASLVGDWFPVLRTVYEISFF